MVGVQDDATEERWHQEAIVVDGTSWRPGGWGEERDTFLTPVTADEA